MRTIAARPKAWLPFLFLATTFFLVPAKTRAQICAGSNLRYVVRDEHGKVIDPAGTFEAKPKIEVAEVKDADKVLRGVIGNSVQLIRARGMCNFKEPVKLSLNLKGKVMNLTFLMPRFGEYESRSFMVDSIPFQAGSFEINLDDTGEKNPAGDWLGSFFPARGWKKVVAQ